MLRNLLITTTLLLVFPVLLFAQDGKLRGKVADRESGDPLIGANVVIDGTSLGASTDISGEYVILAVPPGTYAVKVSYIGYSPVTISNIRVGANLTVRQDFALSTTAIAVEAVEIVADRPLIQRNTTNTVRVTTQENIKNLPFRGLQNIIALEAGVVQQNGNLYVRGGRSGEVAYFVDGAGVTNPIFNSENVSVIQEAVEELQLQAGGYTAELGGSNAGIARTTMRSGGSSFTGSIDYQTDDFAKPGEEFLGTTSRGYRNAVVTVGGPLPFAKNVKLFFAGQHNYVRNRQAILIEPFKFENLLSDVNDARGAGQPLPGPIEFKRNYLYNNYGMTNTFQGTVLWDLAPFKLKATASYDFFERPSGGQWPTALRFYFNQGRNLMQETGTYFGNVRLTHVINPTTFYEIGVWGQLRSFRSYDPDFGDDWKLYADSTANADKGFTGFRAKYRGPNNYSIINAFTIQHENSPNNSYSKNEQMSLGFSADLTSQLDKNWELKAGGRLESWTVRNWAISDISSYMRFAFGEDGKSVRTFTDAQERRIRLAQRGVINHYGFDVDGNKVDSGVDAPPQPMFASAYVQNRFEYDDLILNLGVRFEYFDTDHKSFSDPNSLKNANFSADFDPNLDVINEQALVGVDPFQLVLPRVSFSFPVTDKTVFYAQYGKYAQMPSLNQLYVGTATLSRSVSPITRGNAFLTPVGFFMKPERTTQYEMGIRQLLSDNFAFTVSGFYKDLKDQLNVRLYAPEGTRLFISYLNEDFGTTKGVELTLELRRTNRLAAKVNYTLSDAQGTGSDPRSAQGAIEQNIGRPISIIAPLAFNQAHRGSIMLDYRFAKGDGGPILEGLGANVLLTFNSGHNYTRVKEPTELGQSNPWDVGVENMNDPRSSFPVEPLNNSTTPWIFNVDLNLSKMFYLGDVNLEFYVNVLNLFNSKQILNVYPTTGTAQDDGWLTSPLAAPFAADPQYVAFYKAINQDNRWAYMGAGRGQVGTDIYGAPRQIRVGLKLEM